ncbi:HD domain-containing protein [Vagococcus allomyrinae]
MIGQMSAIVSAAGLLHDIGNPPFGHYGETSIKVSV